MRPNFPFFAFASREAVVIRFVHVSLLGPHTVTCNLQCHVTKTTMARPRSMFHVKTTDSNNNYIFYIQSFKREKMHFGCARESHKAAFHYLQDLVVVRCWAMKSPTAPHSLTRIWTHCVSPKHGYFGATRMTKFHDVMPLFFNSGIC